MANEKLYFTDDSLSTLVNNIKNIKTELQGKIEGIEEAMPIDWFGSGKAIPENADLNANTYKALGKYYCSSTKTAATITNAPVTNDNYVLFVFQRTTSNIVTQMIITLGGRLFIRSISSDENWSSRKWNEKANKADIPTKLSQLENDLKFQTPDSLAEALGDLAWLDAVAYYNLNSELQGAIDKANSALQTHQSLSHLATKTELAGKTSPGDVSDMIDNYDEVVMLPALNAKVNTSSVGAANGIAPLDSAKKIPSSYLPSYVDDVIEYTSKSSFPSTGVTGVIYVDTTTNLTWRWSGSAYVEISPSLALGTTSSTAYAGDKGQEAHDNASLALDKVNSVIAGTTPVPNANYAVSAKNYTAGGTIEAISTLASQTKDIVDDILDGGTTVPKATTATSAVTATSATTATNYSAGGTIEGIKNNAEETRAIVDDILDGGTTVSKATTATNATQLGGVAAASYARTSQLPIFTFVNGVLTITTNN